jgi:hypothetical protein
MDWQAIREALVLIGAVVGLVGGSLGIYYHSTSNRILLKRFRREEEAKEIDARADEFLRLAHEIAVREGGSTMRMIPFELNSEIERKVAWKLCKDGKGRMADNILIINVDLLPPMIARDMARRAALREPDHYH